MYNTLLQLPLFQGFCKADFTQVLEKVQFHFHRYKANEIIVKQGDSCNELIFLLSGELISQTTDPQKLFLLQEWITQPTLLEPHSIFGMSTSYTATYKANTDLSVVTISKSYLLTELSKYEIFRMNYCNIISNRVQIAHEKLWNSFEGTTQNHIITFLLNRTQFSTGQKKLSIRMEDLATLIDDTRTNVSKELNALQKMGIVQLGRKEIIIPAFEKLLELSVK
ncbi:MAG: Crp/Fnr family transcriptional regulator [Phocaeicola sp.]